MFGGVFNQQTKLQMTATFRSSATGTDVSDCTTMSGLMKKKNRNGIWQKRYFALNNDYLVYKKDANAGSIKGAFDLRDIISVQITERGSGEESTVLEISLEGGGFPLKCSSSIEADKWVTAIKERIDWTKTKAEEEQSILYASSTYWYGTIIAAEQPAAALLAAHSGLCCAATLCCCSVLLLLFLLIMN